MVEEAEVIDHKIKIMETTIINMEAIREVTKEDMTTHSNTVNIMRNMVTIKDNIIMENLVKLLFTTTKRTILNIN
jgi:hypothetical protein